MVDDVDVILPTPGFAQWRSIGAAQVVARWYKSPMWTIGRPFPLILRVLHALIPRRLDRQSDLRSPNAFYLTALVYLESLGL